MELKGNLSRGGLKDIRESWESRCGDAWTDVPGLVGAPDLIVVYVNWSFALKLCRFRNASSAPTNLWRTNYARRDLLPTDTRVQAKSRRRCGLWRRMASSRSAEVESNRGLCQPRG